MNRSFRFLALVGSLFALSSCADTQGCTNLEKPRPLDAEFPLNSRVENALSLRLTSSGVEALQQQLTDIILGLLANEGVKPMISIPIDPVPQTSILGTKIDVCKEGANPKTGECIVEADLSKLKLKLALAEPLTVNIDGSIPIRIRDLAILVKQPLISAYTMHGALTGNSGECDQQKMVFATIPFKVELSVLTEKNPARAARRGYSAIKIKSIKIDNKAVINSLHFCGGTLTELIINAIKSYIGGQIMDQISTQIVAMMNSKLCQPVDPARTPPCPKGSSEKDGICMFEEGVCVARILGADGHVDVGTLAASVSPGLQAGIDGMMAAGGISVRPEDKRISYGDLYVVNKGLTLGMYAGVLPSPQARCVSAVPLVAPAEIGQPDEMLDNSLSDWKGAGPHVGAALAERFANYALASMYNSGSLCLNVSTEQSSMLSTGLLSLLVPSMPFLAMQRKLAPVKVALRPQQPPSIVFGSGQDYMKDPHVRIALHQAAADFYVWSTDRFVRALTATFDIDVPVNLDMSSEGITPVVELINVNDTKVTNSDLLTDDAEAIAQSLKSVIQATAGDYLGEIPPVDITKLLPIDGVTISWQQAGIKKLTKGSDRFLGIFFNLEKTDKTALQQIANKSFENESWNRVTVIETRLANHTPAEAAKAAVAQRLVTIQAESSLDDGKSELEYAYRVDRAPWHRWNRSSRMVVSDAALALQGTHTISVKSRIAGRAETQTANVGTVQVVIDTLAPVVQLSHKRSATQRFAEVNAWDIVAPVEQLQGRYAIDDHAYSSWKPLEAIATIALPDNAKRLAVQVRDGQRNTADKVLVLKKEHELREIPQQTGNTQAANCTISRSIGYNGHNFAGWFGLLALGWLWRTQREKHRKLLTNLTKSTTKLTQKTFSTRIPIKITRSNSIMTIVSALGTLSAISAVGCWDSFQAHANAERDASDSDSNTGLDGDRPKPPCGTPGGDTCIMLQQGLIGAYTSAAVAADGSIWVAGYNEGDWQAGVSYGDLVVGKWDGSNVNWQIVDGIPSQKVDDAVYDKNGWRGGQHKSGDDVGQWTSMQINDTGHVLVTYWDVTNQALKLAIFDGSAWRISQIYKEHNGEGGRYGKLIMQNDKPVVVFQTIEKGDLAQATSKVVMATATVEEPDSPNDWQMMDIAVEAQTPCRNHLCAAEQKCFAQNATCGTVTSECNPPCATGNACNKGKCEALIDGTKLDTHPAAIGNYIAVAKEPSGHLGIVFYDGVFGNLVRIRHDASDGWIREVIDGQSGAPSHPKDTGNVGVGAALAIDAEGAWHIAYMDKTHNALKYMHIATDGKKALQVVDDGYEINGKKHLDAPHFVGEDASISVSASGQVRIAYQDATQGTLRWATREANGSQWTKKEVSQEYFSGFFSQQLEKEGRIMIVNWWRKGGDGVRGDVRILEP